MTKKFAELTAFIPRIKDDKYGEWIRVNQGTVSVKTLPSKQKIKTE